jgi:predicted permease
LQKPDIFPKVHSAFYFVFPFAFFTWNYNLPEKGLALIFVVALFAPLGALLLSGLKVKFGTSKEKRKEDFCLLRD